MVRKGMGKGTGKGYKNLMGSDKKIHSQSARGIKQPQRINPITNKKLEKDIIFRDYFGKPIYSYSTKQAIKDGILMENYKANRFNECNIVTTNLYEKIKEVAFQRNLKRVFPIHESELLGSLMMFGNKIYSEAKFKDDQDKNFFVIPKTEEGLVVWFVRNEEGKLTAMLPSDY